MTSIRVLPSDLAALMGGGPAIAVADDLPRRGALEVPGLDLWLVRALPGGDRWLYRTGSAEPADLVSLDWPPAGLLALVDRDPAALETCAGWWDLHGQRPPSRILAADGAAAWPEIAAVLVAALVGATAGTVALHRSLAVLRRDHEDNRIALGAATRLLAHQPPSLPRLLAATDPGSAVLAPQAEDSLFRLVQPLAVPLEGLARLAVHIARRGPAPDAALLRFRLAGAESGRIHGAWAVPLASLAPGWLALDLPSPIGAVAEGAVLSLLADPVPAEAFALSLDAGWTEAEAAAQAPGAPPDRALALRLWTAEPRSRFLAPAFWRWDEAGLTLPEPGLPHAMAASAWGSAQALAGEVSLVGLGEEAPRALLRGAAGGAAGLLLAHVFGGGLDVLRLRLALRGGSADAARACLRVLPLDQAPTAPGGAWSGWRGFDATGLADIAVTLPVGLGLRFQVIVELAGPDGAPLAADTAAEVTRIDLLAAEGQARFGERLAIDQAQPPPPILVETPAAAPEPPAPAAPDAAAPEADAAALPAIGAVEAVMLNQYYPPTGSSDYRHLDMTVLSLAVGDARWPSVRFKLALSGGRPRLEFREAAGQAPVFTRWLPSGQDRFGDFLRLGEADLPARLAEADAAPRDTLLLRSLLRLLPAATATAARAAGLAPADLTAWLEAARLLAAIAGTGEAVAAEEPESVILNQHFAGTGDYRHLDVSVLNLRQDGLHWPIVRLKLGRTARLDTIEFRQTKGWPQVFETWAETGFDRFGPFIRLSRDNLRDFVAGLAAPRDAAMIERLLERLPEVMAAAGTEAGFDADTIADWQAAAAQLGAALRAGPPSG